MKKWSLIISALLVVTACGSKTSQPTEVSEQDDSTVLQAVAPHSTVEATADGDREALTFENMEGIYDSLDENMNSESRISLMSDGTATWGMIGSLHFTEYTYTISGNTICLKPKDVDSEEDCYVYDSDTRTLKNEQGATYYRQVKE